MANVPQARMNAAPRAGDVACHGRKSSTPNSTTQARCELAMSRDVRDAGATEAAVTVGLPGSDQRIRVPIRPHRISVMKGSGRSDSSPLRYE